MQKRKKRNYLLLLLLLFSIILLFFLLKKTKYSFPNNVSTQKIIMKDLLGINGFEWDVLQDPKEPEVGSRIYEPKFESLESFGLFRHYIDWDKLENTEGNYSFNPTWRGSWNYDIMYERFKKEGITVLACIKNSPNWLYQSFPMEAQDTENIPLVNGSDRKDPKSYIAMGKVAFQFAARYGANKEVPIDLVKVNPNLRWAADVPNEVKIGLNTIKYIECNNEPDKWWKGEKSEQSAAEYAANLSAFYDGHMGKLGKNVGVKSADSNLLVVMGGLASPDTNYVRGIVDWCIENRGYKENGEINLCFDILNYHLYANNNDDILQKILKRKRGIAPELSKQGKIADQFTAFAKKLNSNMQVWVTETGYDIHQNSPHKAISIGDKSELITQADWTLRTSLLFARHGINKAFYYLLNDVNLIGGVYGSSGFVGEAGKRPVADYFSQVKNLMGNYRYVQTIYDDPLVDVYALNNKKIYILTIPDEVGRTADYKLNLKGHKKAKVYYLKAGAPKAKEMVMDVKDGYISVKVTETPLLVQGI